MSKADGSDEAPASERIDAVIDQFPDWRGATLSRMRGLIKEADPDVVEEIKWVKPSNPLGVPTWSHDGIICTGETYKAAVKLTFMEGASLDDPTEIFNSSLTAGTRRAVDIKEGDELDAVAFKDLIRAAVAFNASKASAKKK